MSSRHVVAIAAVPILLLGTGCSRTAAPAASAPVAAAAAPVPTTATPPAAPAVPAPAPAVAPPPPPPAPSSEDVEARLRGVVQTWRKTPYRDNGTTKAGIGNAEFVRAVFEDARGANLPARYDDQMHTGKLVERPNLAPGDLVFFESGGFGPFKSKVVGLYLGHGDVALARKDEGIGVVKLTDAKLNATYKTARRISASDSATPTFDVAKYGSDRAALLRDIAKAWAGTLYRANGTTFSGIGNDEFVREVYGAIYETDLEGDPKTWATMGHAVARDKLEPGDIILYEAEAVGPFIKQRHAGIYLGEGEFVAAVKGSAVRIVKLDEPRWRSVYKGARRIDPDALARAETAHDAAVGRGPGASTRAMGTTQDGARFPAVTAEPRTLSDTERRLRDVTEDWRGTPYKLGGSSKSGIDCSAFSRVLYQNVYEVELPRTAEEQELLGAGVGRDSLQAGDLVFFRTQGMGPLFKSRHVGVYLGGGEFAQASGRHGVTISRLDQPYWSKKYHSARRVPRTAAVAANAGAPDL